jgi:hypothetical protein
LPEFWPIGPSPTIPLDRLLRTHHLRQNYIATMGEEFGGVFDRLHNECAWLHLKWSEYVALFGVSRSRTEILNASASGFFVLLRLVALE